jgi:hypothetical protein
MHTGAVQMPTYGVPYGYKYRTVSGFHSLLLRYGNGVGSTVSSRTDTAVYGRDTVRL